MSGPGWRVRTFKGVNPINGDTNVFVQIQVPKAPQQLLRGWSLIFEAKTVVDGSVHAWILDGRLGKFAEGATDEFLIGSPGSSRSSITVASHASKNSWDTPSGKLAADAVKIGEISYFSSPGPTRDSRQKPEVSAPGQFIASALSSNITPEPEFLDSRPGLQLMQGTSMSSPHVAGAVALLLEKRGKLTPTQVVDALKAATDQPSTQSWDKRWGFGKLNLGKLLK